MYSQIKADREALSCACGARLEGLPNARRSRWRAEGQTERKLQHGARSMETIELWKRIKSLR